MNREEAQWAGLRPEDFICPRCDGKGFVNPDGSPNNSFKGNDREPVETCPLCGDAGKH